MIAITYRKAMLIVILLFAGIQGIFAQADNGQTIVRYRELNMGVAYMGRDYTETGFFPGASFLWGRTSYSAGGLVVDRQLGVAFPTILTGKIGVGYGSEKGAALVGIRPWPPSAYIQGNIGTTKGTVVFTAELSHPEFGYSSIFTAGYRWNRGK